MLLLNEESLLVQYIPQVVEITSLNRGIHQQKLLYRVHHPAGHQLGIAIKIYLFHDNVI